MEPVSSRLRTGMSTATLGSRAFAALGHDARQNLLRMLEQAGPDGPNVARIGAIAGLAPSTPAHHPAALRVSGLADRERGGRGVLNRAEPGKDQAPEAFLTRACSAGMFRHA